MDDNKSSDGAAEIDPVGRKHSVNMVNQASIIRNNNDDRNDHTAQRDDEETVSAASTMARRRGTADTKKQAKALRGRVLFDDMCHHFGCQRVDPTGRSSNTSLAHLCGEMWFGDLDFSIDAAALLEQSDATPPYEQRSPRCRILNLLQ